MGMSVRDSLCILDSASAEPNPRIDVVEYLISQLPTSSLIRPNAPPAANTPLHWAAMNHQLPVLKLLCPRLTVKQISATNGRGKSAMSVAMEGTGRATRLTLPKEGEEGGQEPQESEEDRRREDCVSYLVEMMRLGEEEEEGRPSEGEATEDGKEQVANPSSLANGVNGLKLSDTAN